MRHCGISIASNAVISICHRVFFFCFCDFRFFCFDWYALSHTQWLLLYGLLPHTTSGPGVFVCVCTYEIGSITFGVWFRFIFVDFPFAAAAICLSVRPETKNHLWIEMEMHLQPAINEKSMRAWTMMPQSSQSCNAYGCVWRSEYTLHWLVLHRSIRSHLSPNRNENRVAMWRRVSVARQRSAKEMKNNLFALAICTM